MARVGKAYVITAQGPDAKLELVPDFPFREPG